MDYYYYFINGFLLKCILIVLFQQWNIGNQVEARNRNILPLDGFFSVGDVSKSTLTPISSSASFESKEENHPPNSVKKRKESRIRRTKKKKNISKKNKNVKRKPKMKSRIKNKAKSFWTKDEVANYLSRDGKKPFDIIVHIKVNE